VSEADPVIRRLQWGGVIWCVVAVAVALIGWPGRLDMAAGIVGGGVLTAVSFLAIKSSIDAVLGLVSVAADDPGRRRRIAAGALFKMTGRYALLAVLAYVMIARLRLHPVGLIVGASSLVVSAAFEAGRWVSRI
jgi:hypothetical protein